MFENFKETVKTKARAAKEKVKWKAVDAVHWAADNKEVVVPILTIGVAVTGKALSIGKEIARGNRVKRLERMQDNRVWDPVSGHFWQLKRKLDRNEQLYLEREIQKGRNRGNILNELGVLR